MCAAYISCTRVGHKYNLCTSNDRESDRHTLHTYHCLVGLPAATGLVASHLYGTRIPVYIETVSLAVWVFHVPPHQEMCQSASAHSNPRNTLGWGQSAMGVMSQEVPDPILAEERRPS